MRLKLQVQKQSFCCNSQKAYCSTIMSSPDNVYPYDDEDQEESRSEDYHGRCSPGDVKIPNRIFVKGFAKECTEEELKAFFEIYGIVHEAKIVNDKSGLSRGYAFISFDRQEIAEKVIEMGKVLYKGREIVIGAAKIRKRKPVWPRFYDVQPFNAPTYIAPDGLWYYQIPPSPVFSPPPSSVYQATEPGFQQIPWVPAQEDIQVIPSEKNSVNPQESAANTANQHCASSTPRSIQNTIAIASTTHHAEVSHSISQPSVPQQNGTVNSPSHVSLQNTITSPVSPALQQNGSTINISPYHRPQCVSYVQNVIPTSLNNVSTTPIFSSKIRCNNVVVTSQPQTTYQQTFPPAYNVVEMRTMLPSMSQQPYHHVISNQHSHPAATTTIVNTQPFVYSAPVHCIPIQYDSRYIEDATPENLHTNVLYFDPTKVYPSFVNEIQ